MTAALPGITGAMEKRGDTSGHKMSGSAAEGLYLTAHDDLSAVMKVVAQLGYELSEEDARLILKDTLSDALYLVLKNHRSERRLN